MRFPNNSRADPLVRGRRPRRPVLPAPARERGAAAIQFLVILVPVLFGFIGFAVDLGILYSMKGELKAGASAMALSAAQQLIGTDAATSAAATALQATGNSYYFHGLPIGQTTGSKRTFEKSATTSGVI